MMLVSKSLFCSFRKSYTPSNFRLIRNFCDAVSKADSGQSGACGAITEKKGLILGLYLGDDDGPVLTPAACRFNDKTNGKLLEHIVGAGDLNKRGRARLFNNMEDEYWSISVVCLGKKNLGMNTLEAIDEGREAVRFAAGLGAQLLHSQKVGHIFVEGLGRPEQAAEGAALAIYRYQDNKTKANRSIVPTLELYDDPDHDAWQRGFFKAEAQNVARQLCDTPSNQLTPTALAQTAVNILCPCGIKVDIHDKEWIEHMKLSLILAATRGSCEPPVVLEVAYCGGPPEQKPVILVGSGVTYDSGGLCLKSEHFMYVNRSDVIGAASVIATIKAASMLSLPLNVIGFMPLIENMPSGMAVRPGDVYKTISGLCVEIENTDHEGRLLLADSLQYVQQLNPRMIVDVGATTEEMRGTLGCGASGCFSNSEVMWKQLRKAGMISGDRVWRLPLWGFYRRRVCNDYVNIDLNNQGKGGGAPCLAAAFFSKFVHCIDWIHMDTTGVGQFSYTTVFPYYALGRQTGRPVRTLVQLLYQLACPNPCDRPI